MSPTVLPANTEALIDVNRKTGQMQVHDFNAAPGAVNLVERNIHMINCLSTLMHNARLTDEVKHEAEISFSRAFGRQAMLETGIKGPRWVDALNTGYFKKFLNEFAGLRKHEVAFEKCKQLSQQITDWQSIAETIYEA
jgi:hypothetical protein